MRMAIQDAGLQARAVEAWAYAIAQSSFTSIRHIPPAGNPDVQAGVDIIVGPGTEAIAGEGKILTAGGFINNREMVNRYAPLLRRRRFRAASDGDDGRGIGFTLLVVVRADFPPLVQPGDKFDVKVRLPDGSVWQFRFAKEFCNVARPAGQQRNQLPDLILRQYDSPLVQIMSPVARGMGPILYRIGTVL